MPLRRSAAFSTGWRRGEATTCCKTGKRIFAPGAVGGTGEGGYCHVSQMNAVCEVGVWRKKGKGGKREVGEDDKLEIEREG
jgi:hypothetical protein